MTMKYDEAKAMREGWLLSRRSDGMMSIQKFDSDPKSTFASDREALEHVMLRADAGDPHARYCLEQLTRIGRALLLLCRQATLRHHGAGSYGSAEAKAYDALLEANEEGLTAP